MSLQINFYFPVLYLLKWYLVKTARSRDRVSRGSVGDTMVVTKDKDIFEFRASSTVTAAAKQFKDKV